jgi:hypothetical protein
VAERGRRFLRPPSQVRVVKRVDNHEVIAQSVQLMETQWADGSLPVAL